MKKLKLITGLAIFGAAAALTAPVHAMNIGFDEGAVAQTGTISYDGDGGALQGRDLAYTTILGTDTPANSGGILACVECRLNFDTGTNLLEGPSEWHFRSGGSFTLTGTVTTLGGGTVLIDDDVILSGSFSGRPNVTGGGGNALFVSLGTDEKHEALTAWYGIPDFTEWQFAHTDLALASCDDTGSGGFDCDVLNSDLNNIAVPVPAPLALLGLGLLALGASRGRRS